jgi:phosphatidylglycerol---prolipoprotein diacylglyceryl transferase
MTLFEITLFGIVIAPTYYGFAYAIGMIAAYEIVKRQRFFSPTNLDFLFYAVVMGIILGGRLGYVVFYNLPYYLEHPLKILAIHDGGMSFHGGIIGVIIGLLVTSYVRKIPLLKLGDAVGPVVPIGICLGRIANYLNNELVGFAGYTGPFAMMKGAVSHFPSPLLQALLE